MTTTYESDRIDKGIEESLNAPGEGQVEGQVKEQGEEQGEGEGQRREEQGEEQFPRSHELSEHSNQSSSPSLSRPSASSRLSRERHNTSRDKSSDSSKNESHYLSGDDSSSEAYSEESDPESLGWMSATDSIVVSDETGEADSSKAAADLTNFLNNRFNSHRRTLQSELSELKDNTEERLYSDPEIQREFTAKVVTTSAARSTRESACDAGGKPIDTTFGHRAIVGSFSLRRREEPGGFQHEKVPIAHIAKHLAQFDRSHEKSISWVHLPANNLLWVQDAMLALLNVRCKDMALCKKTVNRILRRERNAIRRASRSKTPAMMQPLPSTCRKIKVSERNDKNRLSLPVATFMMPYLHWERSISRLHTTSIIKDAQKVAEEISLRNRKTVSVQEVSSLPCTGFEKMVRYHSVGRPGLLVRQTLDHYYYKCLDSTESRDRDQVVERYSRGRNWQDYEHRILMVDQLWIWILDDETILTCFPNSFPDSATGDEPDGRDILPSLLKYLEVQNKRRWIRNVNRLAWCIIDRCASNVYDQQLPTDEKFDFLGMFQHSIAKVMEEQSKLYADMSRALQKSQGVINIDAGPEFRLLEEAKDILDELQIMRDVNLEQATSLKTLSSLALGDETAMRRYFLDERPRDRFLVMKEVADKAKSAYNAINHIIELKQSQGNLLQATTIADLMKSSNELAESSKEILQSTKDTLQQSKKSGETLMVFTVVTILFLPLSTLASFFSLNARELNDGHLTIGIVFAYIFPLSVFIISLSLLFGFSQSARQAIALGRRSPRHGQSRGA